MHIHCFSSTCDLLLFLWGRKGSTYKNIGSSCTWEGIKINLIIKRKFHVSIYIFWTNLPQIHLIKVFLYYISGKFSVYNLQLNKSKISLVNYKLSIIPYGFTILCFFQYAICMGQSLETHCSWESSFKIKFVFLKQA